MATLEDKIILIIGGSSGMGYGVAEASLKSQARVVIIASSNKERVEGAVKRLSESKLGPGEIRQYVVDASSEESLKALLEDVGEVDHVVFTSGRLEGSHVFPNVDITAAKKALDIKIWGAVAVAKYAKFRSKGSLTLTSGTYALKPAPKSAITAVSNGGLNSLAKGLAVDLAPIRVNVICSGAVKTELWDRLPEARREHLMETIPPKLLVKHIGTPSEIAEAFLFCMKCDFITGQIIVVDGGQLLGS